MFRTRLISGVLLLVIAICVILLGGPVLDIALWFVSSVGYLELVRAFGLNKKTPEHRSLIAIGYTAIFFLYISIWCCRTWQLEQFAITLIIILLVFFACMFLYVFSYPKLHAEEITETVFSFLYAPLMLSYIDLTRNMEMGEYIVWLILISSWGCDTCAYCVGKLIGKHKMSPILSPKKSIEGAIGGVAGSAIIGAVFAAVLFSRKYPDISLVLGCALICGLGALLSMVGDLAASAIKRDKNLKDYGNLIPGHGGIMDRFDSVIFTAPATYFLAVVIFEAGRIMR